jgi:hypothetical protein
LQERASPASLSAEAVHGIARAANRRSNGLQHGLGHPRERQRRDDAQDQDLKVAVEGEERLQELTRAIGLEQHAVRQADRQGDEEHPPCERSARCYRARRDREEDEPGDETREPDPK